MTGRFARKSTYARAVLVRNVTVLERVPDFLLKFGRELVIAIDHVRVAPARLNKILNLLGSNASPILVSTHVQLLRRKTYQ